MITDETTVVQGEGNKEVQELINKWIGIAQQGELCACAIVGCAGMGKMGMEYAGIVGKEADVYLGLDRLKISLMESIMNRQIPAKQDDTLDASHHVYARTYAPHCYDFVTWLAAAEMERVKENAPYPLKVCFYGEPDTSNTHAKTMFYHVMRPSLNLVGAVESIEALGGRRSDYTTAKPIQDMSVEGVPVPRFKPSAEADAAVKKEWPQPYITITLREAEHFPHRNSNIPEWIKLADHIKAQGYKVVFVRDTAKADETIQDYETCPQASKDLDYRVAFYKNSICNIATANGPATLHWFLDVPFMNFTHLDDNDPYKPNTNEWWTKNHGISQGQQFNWFLPSQKIYWHTDNAEEMIQSWEEHKQYV